MILARHVAPKIQKTARLLWTSHSVSIFFGSKADKVTMGDPASVAPFSLAVAPVVPLET